MEDEIKTERYIYSDCVLAYLDILGFTEVVKRSKKDSKLIKELVEKLGIGRVFVNSSSKGRDSVDIRNFFFSDSFVFIIKKKEHLPHLFLVIRYLQDWLWKSDLCLRGAVVKGKMYWPEPTENIILGPAMIKAYELESKIAIYPRIIIDEKLVKIIRKEEIVASPLSKEGVITNFIKRDEDGIYFFDILNPKITRKKNEKIANNNGNLRISWDPHGEDNYEALINHLKKCVDKKLKDNKIKRNPELKQKYEWLQTYINSVREIYESR